MKGFKMKRRLWILTIFVLSTFTIIKCWADNELQLPPGHWSYIAMQRLVSGSVLDDYSFILDSNENLTRLEMAYFLKQLLIQLEKKESLSELTASQRQQMTDLLNEFSPELTLLGVEITDLTNIAPSLRLCQEGVKGYFDLDLILSGMVDLESGKLTKDLISNLIEPYYLMGEYLTTDLSQRIFFFLPEETVEPSICLLKPDHRWDVVHTHVNDIKVFFLVVRGGFPMGPQTVNGYYLFPVDPENSMVLTDQKLNETIYNLLSRLSQNYEVNSVWQLKGRLPLANLSSLDSSFGSGIQIGDLLVSTDINEALGDKKEIDVRQSSAFEDLDQLLEHRDDNLELDLKMTGAEPLPQSLHGLGLDFLSVWDPSMAEHPFVMSLNTRMNQPTAWGGYSPMLWGEDWLNEQWSWLVFGLELISMSEEPLLFDLDPRF